MKKNQKGFSVVEMLIVLVVVGLIGVAGWFVFERQNNKTETATQQTQQNSAKDTPKTTEQEEQSQLVIPDGWVKYGNGILGFYYPNEWEARDTDFSEYGKPADIDLSIDFVDSTKIVGGFMSYKTAKGYDFVLKEAMSDKLIDSIKEQSANGVKVISYTAYGTADKDLKNANLVSVIFLEDKEYKLFVNPTTVDSETAVKILKTIQKN